MVLAAKILTAEDLRDVLVVNLAPRESECVLCGAALVDARHGIACFEGEPVTHSWQGDWGGNDACPVCWVAWELVNLILERGISVPR